MKHSVQNIERKALEISNCISSNRRKAKNSGTRNGWQN